MAPRRWLVFVRIATIPLGQRDVAVRAGGAEERAQRDEEQERVRERPAERADDHDGEVAQEDGVGRAHQHERGGGGERGAEQSRPDVLDRIEYAALRGGAC